jgi:syntaxin 1B/2/3
MSGNRLRDAETTLESNRLRSDSIRQLERELIAIAQLFEQLENIVVQQEEPIQNIEQKAEEVKDNTGQANVELGGATEKASAARSKKFWCLGIASKSPAASSQLVISSLH